MEVVAQFTDTKLADLTLEICPIPNKIRKKRKYEIFWFHVKLLL